MTQTVTLAIAAAITLAFGACAGQAEAATDADFSAYPAAVFKGPATQPSFRGRQAVYRGFRTRIRESLRAGPAFAGHYAVAVIGCGTSCRFGYITDLKTGLVYDLPYGGEEYFQILYRVRPDSRLLQTQWQPFEDEGKPNACHLEDFLWTGHGFKSLGQRTQAECPDWRDYAD
jgi:hypothetical protein